MGLTNAVLAASKRARSQTAPPGWELPQDPAELAREHPLGSALARLSAAAPEGPPQDLAGLRRRALAASRPWLEEALMLPAATNPTRNPAAEAFSQLNMTTEQQILQLQSLLQQQGQQQSRSFQQPQQLRQPQQQLHQILSPLTIPSLATGLQDDRMQDTRGGRAGSPLDRGRGQGPFQQDVMGSPWTDRRSQEPMQRGEGGSPRTSSRDEAPSQGKDAD